MKKTVNVLLIFLRLSLPLFSLEGEEIFIGGNSFDKNYTDRQGLALFLDPYIAEESNNVEGIEIFQNSYKKSNYFWKQH